jgi:hypothetical protein
MNKKNEHCARSLRSLHHSCWVVSDERIYEDI